MNKLNCAYPTVISCPAVSPQSIECNCRHCVFNIYYKKQGRK